MYARFASKGFNRGFLIDFGVDVCKGLWILASKGHGNFKVNDCDEMAWEGIRFIG